LTRLCRRTVRRRADSGGFATQPANLEHVGQNSRRQDGSQLESVGSTFVATVDVGDLTGATMLTAHDIARRDDHLIDALEVKRAAPAKASLAGLRILLAENGRIAIEQIDQASMDHAEFDVVLMDMQMPELDGYDATRQLRQQDYSGPINTLTANAMAADRTRCLDAGCDDFASKPIDRTCLLDLISRHAANNCNAQPS
jgi:CheY-like chemotaxis protein